MRSATVIASLWSWVTMMKVSDSRRCRSISSNCVSPRSFLSSAAIGSSSRRTRGRLTSERAKRHALALAARQFVRFAAAEIFELHQRQHVGDAFADLRLGQAFLLESEGDIGLDVQMRKQRVALKHHIDRPPIRRHLREIDAVEQDAAGIRLFEAGDQPQQRGLAAAGRSEQRKELALVDVERKLIDGGEAAEALAQALDAQQRLRGAIGPRREAAFGKAKLHRAKLRRAKTLCRFDSLHPCPKCSGANFDRAPALREGTLEHVRHRGNCGDKSGAANRAGQLTNSIGAVAKGRSSRASAISLRGSGP